MYLTPERYRTMGFGVDLTGIEEFELRSALQAASATVDSYCNIPLLPQKHDFRGGTITGEIHPWRIGNDTGSDPGQRRVYFFHRPVKTVTQLRIQVTNAQYVEIGVDDLFLNPIQGWAEVVSLAVTSIGVFGSGLLPNIGLARPMAKVSYTYGWEFAVEGEQLDETDGFTFRAQNQFWVTDSATIYNNGVEVTSGFTLDETEGTVTFDTQPLTDDIITADYTHKLPREIQRATGIVATAALNERELSAAGLGRIEALTLEEITIRRSVAQRNNAINSHVIPEEAAALLDGFAFRTVR